MKTQTTKFSQRTIHIIPVMNILNICLNEHRFNEDGNGNKSNKNLISNFVSTSYEQYDGFFVFKGA